LIWLQTAWALIELPMERDYNRRRLMLKQ